MGVLTLERLGTAAAVRPAGVRARPAVRGTGLHRAAQRGVVPGRRGPRPDRRPHRAAQPRHVQGLAGPGRGGRRAVRRRDDRPRRVQVDQRHPRPPGRRPGPARDRTGDPRRRPRLGRRVPLRRRRVRGAPAAQRRVRPGRRRRAHPGRGRGRRRTRHHVGGRGGARVRLDRHRVVPARRGRRRGRSCWPPTGPASWPSAGDAGASRRRWRAWRWRRSSRCPSRRRSTRPWWTPDRDRHPALGTCAGAGPGAGVPGPGRSRVPACLGPADAHAAANAHAVSNDPTDTDAHAGAAHADPGPDLRRCTPWSGATR